MAFKAALNKIDPRSPYFAFYTPKLLPVTVFEKCGCMPASMKWRHLGHLQLLSRVLAVMAEMEVRPQEEMAKPQGMKVLAVERPGLPEDFASFPALCRVQSSPLVFAPNLPLVWCPLQW